MDDLHTPTVASGPVSNGYSNGDSGTKSLQELMAQRDAIQAELQALGSVLDSVSHRLGVILCVAVY